MPIANWSRPDCLTTNELFEPIRMILPDGPIFVPCDEVGRSLRTLLVETVERQTSIDVSDLARLQRSHRDHQRSFTPRAVESGET